MRTIPFTSCPEHAEGSLSQGLIQGAAQIPFPHPELVEGSREYTLPAPKFYLSLFPIIILTI